MSDISPGDWVRYRQQDGSLTIRPVAYTDGDTLTFEDGGLLPKSMVLEVRHHPSTERFQPVYDRGQCDGDVRERVEQLQRLASKRERASGEKAPAVSVVAQGIGSNESPFTTRDLCVYCKGTGTQTSPDGSGSCLACHGRGTRCAACDPLAKDTP